MGRGLLKFALGYPLGKKGLDWLKIHLVNLHGEKKKSVWCKILYLHSHTSDIYTHITLDEYVVTWTTERLSLKGEWIVYWYIKTNFGVGELFCYS